MEREVFGRAGGGLAVQYAGVRDGEGRSDAGAGHTGDGSDDVQCGISEVADEAGKAPRNAAQCGGNVDEVWETGVLTLAGCCVS